MKQKPPKNRLLNVKKFFGRFFMCIKGKIISSLGVSVLAFNVLLSIQYLQMNMRQIRNTKMKQGILI